MGFLFLFDFSVGWVWTNVPRVAVGWIEGAHPQSSVPMGEGGVAGRNKTRETIIGTDKRALHIRSSRLNSRC